ncbi:3-ketosteroid-9-alpha-hydroxylase subunit A [Nocardioides sp. JQ2195]|uniref:Rieske 2Fe-2S domain-containing protein n=1 Tax=Nocardioides sp. JQ2195 TaxID=2592334 RepID=UPI00143EBF3F|nr:Rieske 2Fe-2S domain-containing protein [Nocardioides sp. JQ2195]QIX26519.1 3-ketosteroid-9-alpha-hydroxylase subunit A [Nocardioides sp. JQ2195]
MSVVETPSDEVRSIEAAAVEERFARGWHCLGLSRNFRDGEPHSIQAFGQKLVVFMGEDEKVNVLDAYCRHMGGDLSQGTVKGNEVACPFHDWRWGGDGRCKAIPYARRVPLRARTATWPTMEQDGMLFVWNDPEGNPPPEEVAIPRITKFDDGEWTDWVWNEMVVHTNAREVIDNVVDMAHFFYVHNGFPTYFKNVFEGHVATQYYDGVQREDVVHQMDEAKKADGPKFIGSGSEAAYHGPSFMIDYLDHKFEDGENPSVLINAHYPIDNNSFMLHFGLRVKRRPGMSAEAAEAGAQATGQGILAGFMQDVEIWRSKTRIDNPLLCEEDGPVYQLRRWYQQFYVDVADVTPEMTDRFEFEIDTTMAVKAWRAEVAANIARRESAGSPA